MIDKEAIGAAPGDDFQRVWAFTQSLEERERHFNDLQARYRILASTWLLATFAGIGYLFSDKVHLPFDPKFAAALTALAGAFGISLLWVVDVLVYHALLVAGYEVGKELEKAFPWLPPIRGNFSVLRGRFDVRWYIALFYIVGIGVLTLIASVLTLLWSSPHRYCIAILILGLGGSVGILIAFLTWRGLDRKKELPRWLKEETS